MAVGHVHQCDCGARWDEELEARVEQGRCHGCGDPIEGRRRNARYCSEDCRLSHWAGRGRVTFRGGAQPAFGTRAATEATA